MNALFVLVVVEREGAENINNYNNMQTDSESWPNDISYMSKCTLEIN